MDKHFSTVTDVCCFASSNGSLLPTSRQSLTLKYTNIAYVDVAGEEGDDVIVVLSTNPSVLLSLYGSLGSDTFIITPQDVDPVVSKNLRGHRGL